MAAPAPAAPASYISIPSQHQGNCASDTIQIIMYFADGYKEYFRALAEWISMYYVPGETPIDKYIITSAKRYMALGNINVKKIMRSASPKTLEGINTGVMCSKHIGEYLRRKNTGKHNYWTYTKPDYDRFTSDLIAHATHLSINNILPPLRASISDRYTENTVGIQFFTMNLTRKFFHTFCLVRHNEQWYIGDNMLGFLIPASNVTADFINYPFAKIAVNDTQNLHDDTYTRKFIWYDVRDPEKKHAEIAEIKRSRSEHIGVYNEPYIEDDTTGAIVRNRLYYNFDPPAMGGVGAAPAMGVVGAAPAWELGSAPAWGLGGAPAAIAAPPAAPAWELGGAPAAIAAPPAAPAMGGVGAGAREVSAAEAMNERIARGLDRGDYGLGFGFGFGFGSPAPARFGGKRGGKRTLNYPRRNRYKKRKTYKNPS